jgi:hypothetical protein
LPRQKLKADHACETGGINRYNNLYDLSHKLAPGASMTKITCQEKYYYTNVRNYASVDKNYINVEMLRQVKKVFAR